jgi:F-type H+-transporting ATPase subunit O
LKCSRSLTSLLALDDPTAVKNSIMTGRHLALTVSRHFSMSAPSLQLVKTPIAVFGTEGRYASALYSAASKQKSLEACEKDLAAFQAQLKKDVRLQEFLQDPSVKKAVKLDGLGSACDKMKMNVLSKNLFLAMAENGRYNTINAVCNSFQTLMSAHRGEIVCEITSAKALDTAMTKEIETAIATFLQKGQKSQITYKVDSTLIGGLVVSIGDRYADMSMATKLKKYEELIKSAA